MCIRDSAEVGQVRHRALTLLTLAHAQQQHLALFGRHQRGPLGEDEATVTAIDLDDLKRQFAILPRCQRLQPLARHVELGKVDELGGGHKPLQSVPVDQQPALVVADDAQAQQPVGLHRFLSGVPGVIGRQCRGEASRVGLSRVSRFIARRSWFGVGGGLDGRAHHRRLVGGKGLFHPKQSRPIAVVYLRTDLRFPTMLLTHTSQPLHP